MFEKQFINKCISEIEKKLNWGKSSEWKHADYVKLSELIYDETGTLLSISSLKRIFGKIKSSHIPQIESRNALAKFAGYGNWNDFVYNSDIKDLMGKKSHSRKKNLLITFMILILIAGGLGAYLYFEKPAKTETAYTPPKLTSNILSATSPRTVIFNYSINNITDSVFIDYDDKYDAVAFEYLPPGNNTITHFYKLPDVYKVRIFNKHKVLKSINITLGSDSWSAFYIDEIHNQYASVFLPNQLNGYLALDKNDIREQGIEIMSNPYYLQYRLIKNFDIIMDSSILSLRVRQNNPLNDLICYTFGIGLICDSLDFKVIFSSNNCYIKSLIQIGDYKEDGHFSDLSELGLDFNGWKTISIHVLTRNIRIYDGDSLISERRYYNDLNSLKGIVFHTSGYWQIDKVTVKDLATKNVYFTGFDD